MISNDLHRAGELAERNNRRLRDYRRKLAAYYYAAIPLHAELTSLRRLLEKS